MRKVPASEQPTQVVVREIITETVKRRQISWVFAVAIFLGVCLFAVASVLLGGQIIYTSIVPIDDNTVVYEVIAREQPVTVASTTGEAASQVPLSPIFTEEIQFWQPLIAEWALAWEIDPNLIATVIQIESCGDPFVSSGAGAQGLFQVMPFHFDPGEDMLDVQNNAARGLAYLNGGLDVSDGHAGLAMAGYNGGHSVIRRGYAVWANETRRYYYWGTGIYEDATLGLTESPRLQEWLAAGGQGLCDRASQSQEQYLIQYE